MRHICSITPFFTERTERLRENGERKPAATGTPQPLLWKKNWQKALNRRRESDTATYFLRKPSSRSMMRSRNRMHTSASTTRITKITMLFVMSPFAKLDAA